MDKPRYGKVILNCCGLLPNEMSDLHDIYALIGDQDIGQNRLSRTMYSGG